MDDAQQKAVLSLARYVLAIGGGLVVARGWANDATVQMAIGLVMGAVPLVFGVVTAFRSEKKTQVREAAAVNAGIALSNETAEPTPAVSPELAKAVIQQYAVQPTEGKP